jgi:non-specific serine/threonine protein kinase
MDFRNSLLDAIKNIPQGHIYYMAPPEFVRRGFDYYRSGKVVGFKWTNNSLLSFVNGTVLYTVSFTFMEKHILSFHCNCPAFTPLLLCKHVIASLFEVKNLLKLFTSAAHSSSSLIHNNLLKELFGFKEDSNINQLTNSVEIDSLMNQRSLEIPNLKLVIDYKGERSEFYFEPNNQKLSLHSKDVPFPADYIYLAYELKSGHYNKRTLVKIKCPIILRTDKDTIELTFDKSLSYRTYTAIAYDEHKVSFKKGVVANKEINSTVLIIDRLAIHPEAKIFGVIEDISGWDFLKEISKENDNYHLSDVPPDIEIPLSSINSKSFYISEQTKKNLIFKGQQTEPDVVAPTYLIDVDIISDFSKGKIAKITPCINISEMKIELNPLVTNFFDAVLNGAMGCLRKYSTKRLILEIIFESKDIGSKEAVNSIIARIIDSMDEIDRYKHKKQLRQFLREYLHNWSELPKLELLFINSRWHLMPFEIEKQISLFELLYECFDEDLFRYLMKSHSIQLPHDKFESELSYLYSIAKSKGIEIRIKGKPIRVSNWSIEVELTKNIDWFELHPDIKRNGETIPQKIWEAIIAGKTEYFMTNNAVEIIDGETKERLNQLLKVIRAGDIKPKSKEIIRIPRLQVLDWIELKQKGIKLTLPPEEERIIQRLLNFKNIEVKPIPKGFQAKPRHYQHDGYNWLCFLYEHRLGGCLADDMGLGKTIQAILLLAATKERLLEGIPENKAPHLIVVPPSLLFNWESEIKRFYPAFTVCQYTGTDRKPEFKNCDIVLTSYDTLRRDIHILWDEKFHIIVFDEAQAIKNIHADRTSSVRQLKGHFKVALTGTPIENHLGEYYSVIDLVMPGLLGGYKNFKSYSNGKDNDLLSMFIKRTRPFVLRRTKEEILKDLPPKTESDIYLDLTPKQKALYERTVKEVRITIDEAYRTKTQAQTKIIVLTALMKLRQVCLCPRLLSEELDEHSPKIDFLVERLKLLIDEDHSTLVFSQFTSFLDIVEKRIKTEGMSFVRLDGSTPVKKRKEIVKNFQEGKEQGVFLLSLKAGGQGLNLTKASYVFHLDPWWNPAVEEQATDRAHRIGQTQKVNVIRLLMRHTIEEKIILLKKRKKALYDAVLGVKGATRGTDITREDIEFLLSS